MSEHNHSHGCGCGGHSHNHEHHACHSHTAHYKCCGKHKKENIEVITETELHFLKHLLEYKFLPVARFILKSSKEHSFQNTALSPVFIIDIKDSMKDVKNVGKKLIKLEDLGLITIDYDIPLKGYAYSEYTDSDIYEYFKQTVNEVKGKEGFLGDTPTMECGSIAPTQKCIELF